MNTAPIYLNRVCLMGHIKGEVIDRTDSRGSLCSFFTLVTKTSWTDKTTGELKDWEERHNIVLRQPDTIITVANNLCENAHVYVEGELHHRKKPDSLSTNPIFVTEIVVNSFNGKIFLLDLPDAVLKAKANYLKSLADKPRGRTNNQDPIQSLTDDWIN